MNNPNYSFGKAFLNEKCSTFLISKNGTLCNCCETSQVLHAISAQRHRNGDIWTTLIDFFCTLRNFRVLLFLFIQDNQLLSKLNIFKRYLLDISLKSTRKVHERYFQQFQESISKLLQHLNKQITNDSAAM
jgi:hypothetical protein